MAVSGPGGALLAVDGDAERSIYARSSMKPLQAAVSLSFAGLDLPDAEVAVMCASHNGERVHREAVRSLLARAGLDESALRCRPLRPMDDVAFAEFPQVAAIASDCSGKHAGMVAACRAQGWPVDSYLEPEHPLQRAVLEAVLAASSLESVRVGVDGCGVPVHAMPLWNMAAIYAGLADPAELGRLADPVRRATSAMRAAPYLVAGRGRVDTALMEAAPSVVAKSGAEGLACAAVPDRGIGVAVRVRDGSSRAAGPVLIETLRSLEVLDGAGVEALDRFARPPVVGGAGVVGELAVELQLRSP